MAENSRKVELERELSDRKESIEKRLEELEDEISTAPAAIRTSIAKHPLVGVAGAVAAGLAVGLLVSGRKKRRSTVAPLHQRLVEEYIDAVGVEVGRLTRKGKSPDHAVREALRERAPVIIYSPESEEDRKGGRSFFAQLGDVALKTALGFAVKTAVDVITASLNVKELQKMLDLEEEERRAGAGGGSPDPAGDGAQEPIGNPAAVDDASPEV